MFSTVGRLIQIVAHDLDPDFLERIAIDLGWGYNQLYSQIAANPDLPDDFRLEQFSMQRGCAAAAALRNAAAAHKVPFEFMRLECNGQLKLLVKSGRVILIQEPISTREDHPRAAQYKVELADIHGAIRQLELDLADRPRRIKDWSGCVLGVLLHGASGPDFTEQHRALGSLMLGVTDAAYGQWMLRVDLHQIAMFGRGAALPQNVAPPPEQRDNVIVTRRKKIEKGYV